MSRVRILNGLFDPVSLPDTVDLVTGFIRSGRRGYLCTVNVAILMLMRSMPRLETFVNNAEFVVADGQPLIWASRLFSTPLPERVAGVDLVDALSERARREGFGIYLLGAHSEVVEEASRRLAGRYPGLKICGAADGYFPPSAGRERARAIAESGAEILIVAMGVPRQEFFIEDHWKELGVSFALGVGGSLDVVAGIRKRAPRPIQVLGLEWIFRLVQEPRKLWKRYLVTNSQFSFQLCKELLRRAGKGVLVRPGRQ